MKIMKNILILAELISILSFLFYGASCLFSSKIIEEFKRYKLSQFRQLVGILQLAGSFGLTAGFYIPIFTLISSLGLAILMLLGVIVRIKIRDPIYAMLPAIFYLVLNFLIFYFRACA
jgi:hypothetical protein